MALSKRKAVGTEKGCSIWKIRRLENATFIFQGREMYSLADICIVSPKVIPSVRWGWLARRTLPEWNIHPNHPRFWLWFQIHLEAFWLASKIFRCQESNVTDREHKYSGPWKRISPHTVDKRVAFLFIWKATECSG